MAPTLRKRKETSGGTAMPTSKKARSQNFSRESKSSTSRGRSDGTKAHAEEPVVEKNEDVEKERDVTNDTTEMETTADKEEADATKEPETRAPEYDGVEKIELEGFGGVVETNNGHEITLKQMVESSLKGVVIFTYPKASTPGCITQASLFRDSWGFLSRTGVAIYGLSADSVKANASFRDKNLLQYLLLSDPGRTLIGAIGMNKAPKGTKRGVIVVGKRGEVLLKMTGGPAATLEAVKNLLASVAL